MKTTFYKRGAALVLVLSFLVLISMLIVAFFSSVMTEATASKSYADGVSTKQLADSAINLVMGTIKEATVSGSMAWASQPGMIRTYKMDGTPAAYYKLYSSGTLKLSNNLNGYFPDSDVATDWDQKPSLYTDLNSPVLVPSVTDPTVPTPSFPIIDPRAYSAGTDTIEGFKYACSNPITGGAVNGVIPPGGSSDAQRLPMPLRWLYVLRDGSITTPSGFSNGAAIWSGDSGAIPSVSNPIVGRMAYWTDDETCKVNINTAAGDLANLTTSGSAVGSFWDTPKLDSPSERLLANNQPCQYEYQRYPGHPATVSLSAVFPALQRPDIGLIAPRVVDGGSEGGGVPTFSGTLAALVPDKDRLYASVDELVFSATNAATGGARAQNPVITPDTLEKAKFFLTANGRSPDLNLFGQPRVCVWPIHNTNSTAYRTPTDNLIAFCTTVGGKPYYFTRQDPTSQTVDWNLLESATGTRRNQELYSYLQAVTGKQIPGFGGSTFLLKYGADRDQILTEIFDYIRIINLHDPHLASTGGVYTPSGQVVPIRITTTSGSATQGFGRFDTISQAALLFYTTGTSNSGSGGTPAVSKMRAVLLFAPYNLAAGYSDENPPNYQYVLPTLGTNGSPNVRSTNFRVNVSGTTTPLIFHGNTNSVVACGGYHYRPWGGVKGIANQFLTSATTTKDPNLNATTGGFTSGACDSVNMYPFVSEEISVSGTAPFTLQDTVTTLQIVSYNQVIQNISLHFPTVSIPIPKIPTADLNLMDLNYRINGMVLSGSNYTRIITSSDSVRSLELSGLAYGDLRLTQANATFPNNTVPSYYYDVHANYFGGQLAHSLTTAEPYQKYTGATSGRLIFNSTTPPRAAALPGTKLIADLMAQGFTSVPMSGSKPGGQLGDWDTGLAVAADGPYINKTDDGTSSVTSNASGGAGNIPYYVDTNGFTTALYSPNRQIASAVQFGSLPTGVVAQHPWQTLLFRPDPDGTHQGSTAPKDYLLLDLFTMPVVEPYAISQPLSTAGRVNMNYRIAPFGYITRSTAARAALESTMVMAISSTAAGIYKGSGNTRGEPFRFQIDPNENTGTLKFFEDRFNYADLNDANKRGLFVSASEICDVPLVPMGGSAAAMSSYWSDYTLTGDNVREMPYAHLYPLLTTKSNTYTVHVRVQTLKKVSSTAADQWVEGKDQILGEYRGSSLFERYIDPQDPRLISGNSNYLNPDSNSLEPLYRFRVLNTKKFAQ